MSTDKSDNQAAEPQDQQSPDQLLDEALSQAEANPDPVNTSSPEHDDEYSAQLFQAQQENQALKDKLLRAEAELQNLHRRQANELSKAYKYSVEKFVKELLPVVDSMEKGIAAATSELETDAKLKQHFEGMQLTHKLLMTMLEKMQLTQINPLGAAFDPNFHEAMTMVPSAEHEAGAVIEVVQKGYLLHDRVIRAAMVVVASAAKAGQ